MGKLALKPDVLKYFISRLSKSHYKYHYLHHSTKEWDWEHFSVLHWNSKEQINLTITRHTALLEICLFIWNSWQIRNVSKGVRGQNSVDNFNMVSTFIEVAGEFAKYSSASYAQYINSNSVLFIFDSFALCISNHSHTLSEIDMNPVSILKKKTCSYHPYSR